MTKTLRNVPIREWEAGDNVQGFALLTKKETRQDRNGKSFLDMEVTDASGSMIAKIWSDSPALNSRFETHQFIAFRGSVKNYREQLQLTIDECREAGDGDRHYGFDESKLIPSTREDIDDLWRRLERIYAEDVERPILRRLAAETLAIHGKALREHPAAKAMHHAYRGGLLEHTVSMAELGGLVCGHYRDLDRDLVLIGVLFHDLGKLRELGAMPANDYTLEGRLIGHVVIGRDLLIERCAAIPGFPADLRVLLEHMVLSHQGKKEFASPVEPMTPEAVALHFIDDLDSKINQLRNSREAATGMQFHRGLGRYVYFPPTPSPADLEAAEEEAEIEAITAEPHALEAAELELPPEEPEEEAEPSRSAPVEIQAGLFQGD
ncbi:MAG TPA: HD domain-containing protein [Thermoanaerobaculia bacterium]|jgi:3'-5' exoribonuclease|nr:HD domain-containing protein [Thermoanaerobaculia bacterium]